MSENLFTHAAAKDASNMPLAERLRPQSLDQIVGQEKILGTNRALRRLLERGELPSLILWGPPGSGKTTLARIVTKHVQADFQALSAVMSGVKELRAIVERAQELRAYQRKRTVLFIDEIHRFNKAQQDALLPHLESGLLTFIGATTENPSFALNAALLSRCKVFVLEPLSEQNLKELVERALRDEQRGLGAKKLQIQDEALNLLMKNAQGDARRALSTLEVAAELTAPGSVLSTEHIEEAAQHKSLLYDKSGEEHYNVVSAFIKSLRGSDPDAAEYWMVRMLEAGEDPLFILRRLVIFASEDIGNADPQALHLAVNALRAFEFMGLPEGALPLTQAVTYLACAPKSNAVLKTYAAARHDVKKHGHLKVPLKLRNAPTSLMKNLGYGQDYKYPHDFAGNYTPETYLPEELVGQRYYEPSDSGYERQIKERLEAQRKQVTSAPVGTKSKN